MYFWTLDRNLLHQHWISWFEPCEIANLRPRADICNLTWLKVSVVFFSSQKAFCSSSIFFRAFPVRVEYRFHDDKHSGCRGGPRFSHTAPSTRRDCIYTDQHRMCTLAVCTRHSFVHTDLVYSQLGVRAEDEPVREVKHFHFTVWPDHGVPVHATPLLNYLKRLRTYQAYDHQPQSPMVMHCRSVCGNLQLGCSNVHIVSVKFGLVITDTREDWKSQDCATCVDGLHFKWKFIHTL